MSDRHDESPVHGHGHAHGDPDPEVQVRPLAVWLVALGVTVLVTSLVLWFLIGAFVPDDEEDVSAPRLDRSRPAGPLLQPRPPDDLEELHRWEDSRLHSYGWSDRSAGLARIPIDAALERAAEEGLPVFSSATGETGDDGSEEPEAP